MVESEIGIPLAGGGSCTFFVTGTSTFSSGTGFFGTSGTLKIELQFKNFIFEPQCKELIKIEWINMNGTNQYNGMTKWTNKNRLFILH